jgi:hypothetical protein
VEVTRRSRADTFNAIKIEFVNRANSYNVEVAEDKDDAGIAVYGLKAQSPRQAHAITDAAVAKKVANIKRLRSVYIDGGNSYRFTLGWQYALLEPMDLVTITDSNLGLNKHPVRITAIKENESGELDFEAEDFPWGTATPTAYPYTGGGGFAPNQQADPGSINTPIIFEPNNRLTGGPATGYEIWMAVSGASPNWGGCHVWISTDGSTYQRIGTIHGGARMGVLTAELASGADPDTTNTLSVDLTESFGTLSSGTQADADNGRTACVIYDGSGNYEVVAYETMNLTAQYKYTSNTYLRRGVFQTGIAAHANGALFARLDDAIFDYEYDPTLIGQTIYFKFTSFNKFELMEQSLANVAAYSYTILGQSNSTGRIISLSPGVQINWGTGQTVQSVTVNAPGLGIKVGMHCSVSLVYPLASGWSGAYLSAAAVPANDQIGFTVTNPSAVAGLTGVQTLAVRVMQF